MSTARIFFFDQIFWKLETEDDRWFGKYCSSEEEQERHHRSKYILESFKQFLWYDDFTRQTRGRFDIPKTCVLSLKFLTKNVNQYILEPGGLVEPAFYGVPGRFKKHENMDGSLETIKLRTTRYNRTI